MHTKKESERKARTGKKRRGSQHLVKEILFVLSKWGRTHHMERDSYNNAVCK
jgi:hypothetical protein